MDLTQLRCRIDEIDEQLVHLFVQRMSFSEAIGNYKKERGLPIHVPQREAEKLESVAALAGPEMAPYTKKLYEAIFTLSREYQHTGEVGK